MNCTQHCEQVASANVSYNLYTAAARRFSTLNLSTCRGLTPSDYSEVEQETVDLDYSNGYVTTSNSVMSSTFVHFAFSACW